MKMNSLRLKSMTTPVEKKEEQNIEALEERINNWLDIQGVQQCDPKDKVDDYFNQKKNCAFQDLKIQSSFSSSDNENDDDDKCSTASSSESTSSGLLSIGASPLMKRRLQKQMNISTSPFMNKLKVKKMNSENYSEIMSTPLKKAKSRFVNQKEFDFEDSE